MVLVRLTDLVDGSDRKKSFQVLLPNPCDQLSRETKTTIPPNYFLNFDQEKDL